MGSPERAVTPAASARTTRYADLAVLVAHLGARDLLVLHRCAPGRYALRGGVGAGERWAGAVEVALAEEPLLREAVSNSHIVVVAGSADARRVLGPYWAATAAVVPVDADTVAVWGHPRQSTEFAELHFGDLYSVSQLAALEVTEVSPATELAHEVAGLRAVQALTTASVHDLDEALDLLARVALEALDATVVLACTAGGRFAAAGKGTWSSVDPADIAAVAAKLRAVEPARTPLLAQDAATRPLPAPLDVDGGIVSYAVVPLPLPVGGALLVAHGEPARGFTDRCRRIAGQLAAAAGPQLRVGELREQVRRLSAAPLRGDPWQEELHAMQERVDSGGSVTVVGVRGLPAVEDGLELLRHSVRGQVDVLAPAGRDTVGVLLVDLEGAAAAAAVDRLRAALAQLGAPAGSGQQATVSVASCPPYGDLARAARRAGLPVC